MTYRLAILIFALLGLAPGSAIGQGELTRPFQLVPAADLALAGLEDQGAKGCSPFDLFLAGERSPDCARTVAAADEPSPSADASAASSTQPPQSLAADVLPYLIPIGMVAAGLVTSLTDSPLRGFRFANEGWFGAGTYAGGADKAGHFVNYTILSRELIYIYRRIGYSDGAAILLGSGMGFLEGLANEFGDGFNRYGFSPQDLTMDAFGAGITALLVATKSDDLIGFRNGYLLPTSDFTCCAVPGKGHDYSYRIYTADLKFAGLGRRLGLDIGPLRYLLFSTTYGSKFYPSGSPELRERQLGFEIGINFEEILNSLGVGREKWWGYGLHLVFDNIRIPFTSVGFQYDLNHGKWYGPSNGNHYSKTP